MHLAGHLVQSVRSRNATQRRIVLTRLLKLVNKGMPVEFTIKGCNGYGGYDALLSMYSQGVVIGGFYLHVDRFTADILLKARLAANAHEWPKGIQEFLKNRLLEPMPLNLGTYPKLYKSLPDYST